MNILIVEDEHIIAKHLQYTLNGFGYQANDIATDYTSAIEILQTKVWLFWTSILMGIRQE